MSHIYEALERAERERSKTASRPSEQMGQVDSSEALSAYSAPEWPAALEIAENAWNPDEVFLPTLAERNQAIEQFRSLRSNLYQLRDEAELKTIVISSALAAEGKTFLATNLALSLARNNEDGVLLIDADLRKPAIHQILKTSNSPGLSDYLSEQASLADLVQRNCSGDSSSQPGAKATSRLAFIPAGETATGSHELVGNTRFEELIASVKPHFDWIIIDSPPVLLVTDAADLARAADGVLLVARGGSTPFESMQRAKASFSHARILGVVLNAVKHVPNNRSYYYYRDKTH